MANTSKRGFASMNTDKQRLIASKGGKAAHAKGTAHEWSAEEARAAGRKGGESRGTRTPLQSENQTSNALGALGSGFLESGGAINPYASNFLAEAGSLLRGSIAPQPLAQSVSGRAERNTYDAASTPPAGARVNNPLGAQQ